MRLEVSVTNITHGTIEIDVEDPDDDEAIEVETNRYLNDHAIDVANGVTITSDEGWIINDEGWREI